jgi:hypothetical protein
MRRPFGSRAPLNLYPDAVIPAEPMPSIMSANMSVASADADPTE